MFFNRKNIAQKTVKKEIKKHFSFLQSDYNFSKFKTSWIKDEFNINCKKENIEFHVFMFQSSTNIHSITIIDHSKPYKAIYKQNEWSSSNHYNLEELNGHDVTQRTTEDSIRTYVIKYANLLKNNPKILRGGF